MTQYKINFKTLEPLILSEEQYHKIETHLQKGEYASSTLFLVIDKDFPLLQLNEVVYVQRLDVNEGESGVIIPKTPAEIRAEKEKADQEKVDTLDTQLVNPELGQNT